MSKPTLTPEQVAKYLQLNRETVYGYIKKGDLAAVKLGRHYRVKESDLDRFMLANSAKPGISDALEREFFAIAEKNKDIPLEEVERDIAEAIQAVRSQNKLL